MNKHRLIERMKILKNPLDIVKFLKYHCGEFYSANLIQICNSEIIVILRDDSGLVYFCPIPLTYYS